MSSTDPANAATAVAINKRIAATFSEAMDPATISAANFTLRQGATPVAGTVTYVGTTATFAPASALAVSTLYTATMTTGVKDLAGNALANNFVWSFTTGAAPDTTAPTVSFTDPANAATAVALNKIVTATFSEAMDPLTISPATFSLKQGLTPVAGTVTYAAVGATATFSPVSALAPGTTYTATISTGAKDLAGNPLLNNFAWSFTTGAAPDTTRPTVIATVPANAATGVATNQTINATFSEAMDPLTISTANFLVTGPATPVIGTVAYDAVSKIATFRPASTLAANTVYAATITTGARDLAGNALGANFAWSFTTAATTAGQGPVVLGSASTFAVLAGSTVTSTGGSMVNGDLGLSPGTAVTGFLPGVVNGTIHAGDAIAAQAQLDLTSAYNDAAGRTVGAITLAGNLGGQTLTPGLYKSTSSLEISSGDLTLDAQGDANAVFIFQMGSTLTTTSGRQVILSGGARAANIFWQVGSSATLGTTSVMKGNILALASITLTTGATLEGRALARTAAVTLDANTVGSGIPADTTAPTVSSTDPANAATAVAINKRIAATFSEAMDPATISAANFTLRQGAT
ncbi:MAG TPA: Ig-like domain-containing protein, partial [Candidatus Dormibacteraeota bacterium]|nr:Ig-like domain-containing protein [Candidatus Dormibacteraeota bacterium]